MNDFLIGMGSVMDISGTYFDNNYILGDVESDWLNVQNDLNRAMHYYGVDSTDNDWRWGITDQNN